MKLSLVPLNYKIDTSSLLYSLKPLGGLTALESTLPEHPNGSWSIISAKPISTFETDQNLSASEINKQADQLKKLLPPTPQNTELPFTGGILGLMSYDFGIPDGYQPKNLNKSTPALVIGCYPWAYLLNHKTQQAYLVHNDHKESPPIEFLVDIYSSNNKTFKEDFQLTNTFTRNWSKSEYKDKFETIQNYINAGDCYQINLTQKFTSSYTGTPLAAYNLLKNKGQVPFASYYDGNHYEFCSASPELFIQVNDNLAKTKPIKGTRPRGDSRAQDETLINELINSEKDRAENLMIVDLLRNDLGKTCNSVTTPKLFDVETFATVHHLVSTVHGELRSNQDTFPLFLNAMPGGSITGAPKKRAMEIIDEVEQQARSFYCGSAFYWSSNQNFNSNILIRSFLFENGKVSCWAGGGIVADSNWEDEYQESLDKISRLMEALA